MINSLSVWEICFVAPRCTPEEHAGVCSALPGGGRDLSGRDLFHWTYFFRRKHSWARPTRCLGCPRLLLCRAVVSKKQTSVLIAWVDAAENHKATNGHACYDPDGLCDGVHGTAVCVILGFNRAAERLLCRRPDHVLLHEFSSAPATHPHRGHRAVQQPHPLSPSASVRVRPHAPQVLLAAHEGRCVLTSDELWQPLHLR